MAAKYNCNKTNPFMPPDLLACSGESTKLTMLFATAPVQRKVSVYKLTNRPACSRWWKDDTPSAFSWVGCPSSWRRQALVTLVRHLTSCSNHRYDIRYFLHTKTNTDAHTHTWQHYRWPPSENQFSAGTSQGVDWWTLLSIAIHTRDTPLISLMMRYIHVCTHTQANILVMCQFRNWWNGYNWVSPTNSASERKEC